MRKLRLLSLCSGIGGIDVAAHWTGVIEIVGQVEVNPFRLAVLAKHFPAVPRMSDITKMRGDEFGPVDSVAGGIPCQPFSHAGKRHGTADDRHLWPFAFPIIQHVHPTWVLIENVAGFIDLALDLVATDLESEKYAVQAYVLPACAVGAPHQRARCFVVAYADSYRRRLRSYEPQRQPQRDGTPDPDASRQDVADSAGIGQRTWRPQLEGQQGPLQFDGRSASCNIVPNSGSQGLPGSWQQRGLRAEAARPSASIERGNSPWPAWRGQGTVESQLRRGHDGLSARLDSHRWPALPGVAQEDWEPSRTITGRHPYRNQRLEALGDAVVPQQIYPLCYWIAVLEGRIPT